MGNKIHITADEGSSVACTGGTAVQWLRQENIPGIMWLQVGIG